MSRSKSKQTAEAGMRSFDHRLPDTVSEAELLALVAQAQRRSGGARHPGAAAAADADRRAAGDRRHRSAPRTSTAFIRSMPAGSPTGLPALVPCTPLGCMMLAKTVHASLAGLEAVVVGRSNIVGKPLAQLLLAENATVTIAHSQDARSAGGLPPRRPAVRRGRAARNGARRLDQARRDRDRCRHQPRRGRGRQDAARRRRRLSRKRRRSPARSRRCRAASGR